MNIFLYNLNLRTWPRSLTTFSYTGKKFLKSFINEVNIINNYYLTKFNKNQNLFLKKFNKVNIISGNINYIILGYKILDISIYNNIKIYSILYLMDNVSTFLALIYIKAFIYKKKVYIFDINKVNFLII